MKLLPQGQLDDLVRSFPGLTEERKRFLTEYAADASEERLLIVMEKGDPTEVAFIRACRFQPAAAA